MPVVSITTRSNLSAPWSRLPFSSPRMRIRSPRTVQQMQPLFIWRICSSPFSMRSLSTPTSPNSFSITAMRWPWSSRRMRLSSVVFPLPRKPVRMVTGTMFCSCMRAPSEGREQVDVLVGARGVARLRRRGRELRRIEHHHVEPRAAVSQGPQLGKHVGFHEVDARRVERIRRQVLLRHLERRRRALDRGDALRAAGHRGDGEAARVAEPVQHFAAGGERAHALPVLPLVEKEAGLLSLLDVDAEVEPVLDDGTARRGAVAAGEAGSLLQALQCSYFGVRALEHRLAAGQLDQRVQDGLAPALDPGGT